MSEQMTELTSSETGSVGAEPAVPNSSDARSEPVAAAAGQPGEVSPPAEISEAPKVEANTDASNQDAARKSGKVVIMSPGDRAWERGPDVKSEPGSRKRRLAALAAVAVLAAATGALGGALATAGLGHFTGDDAGNGNRALEAALVRIDADVGNLKVSLEHTSKVGITQFNKTSERLDKVEKAQAEPAAKLARISEAVEKLRAIPGASAAAAVTPVAAKEVTGSIAPVATAPVSRSEVARSEVARSETARSELARSEAARSEVAKTDATKTDASKPETAKVEVARLPTLEGWVLRDVDHGSALIEGRRGVFEVYAGDPVPGLGRIDAIRRQDGRWVVVTSKGLIVAR